MSPGMRRVEELHARGLLTAEIAAEAGLTVRTVQSYLARLGLISHDREIVRSRTDEACALADAGHSWSEIADRLGYFGPQEAQRAVRMRHGAWPWNSGAGRGRQEDP